MDIKVLVKLLSEFKQHTSGVDGKKYNLENFYIFLVEKMINE